MANADERYPEFMRGLAEADATRRTSARAVGPAPELDATARGIRVLLVDDHMINRKVVKLFLKPFDLEIVEARDGMEALARLEEQAFDLVLMDVHMPVMGGCEAVGIMRASGMPWANVPVIALTADAMPGDQKRYLAAGMDGYVAKPMEQRELFDAIKGALELRTEFRAP